MERLHGSRNDNLADLHKITTALASFDFWAEPVMDINDAVAAEMEAIAWRDAIGRS